MEVAGMLRVSRQTVYNYVRLNQIPHFKIGNKVRFRRIDIENLMQSPAIIPTSKEIK
jgi:excisionase family DNA binding protein